MRLLFALAVFALAAPVGPQTPRDFTLKADDIYRHKPSGLTLPLTLDGLPRVRAQAFSPDQLDEAINFATRNLSEDLTVFVFRNVSGSVPVWFDRSASAAEQRDIYGGLAPVRPAAGFIPPGQANASGLIVSYGVGKGPYRSTALAYVPLGPDWYVVFRYSSATLDGETIDSRLRGAIAVVGWPKTIEAQPGVAPIGDCPTPLALSGEAKPIKRSDAITGSLLFGALMASADEKEQREIDKDDPPPPPVVWCRDTGHYAGLERDGVYRPIGTNDRYLIAYQDAGRGLMVQPDTLAVLIDKGTGRPSWSITEYDIASASSFTPRDRLPAPDQAQTIVTTEGYASKAATWGKNRNIQINSNVLK